MKFKITKKSEDGFDKIILSDDTGTAAEIIPACSAILHSFSVIQNGTAFNVIENYDSAEDFQKNVTSKGFRGSKLSPFLCRLKDGRYHFAGKEYAIEKFYLGKHALHGLLFDQKFEVTEIKTDHDFASVTMKHEYRADDGGYPFNYDCIVTYRLESGNTLHVITQILNRDAGIIPIQDGWHPYFTLGDKVDELQFEFQSKEMIEFDDDLIPTGGLINYQEFGSLKKIDNTSLDNCFTLNFAECQPLCILRNPLKKIQLELHPGKSYPYLQVYTPPHRRSIAIENISSPPNAFNNGIGLQSLSSGESTEFKTTYKITLL